MTEVTEAAPAPEGGETVTAEPVGTPEFSEDDLLDQTYDKLTADSLELDEPKAEEQVEEEAAAEPQEPAEPEEAKEEVELPHDLPVRLKDHWGKLPEDVRDTVTTAHREMAQKVSNATREVNALKPIRGALEEAIKHHPAIANMKPEEVARDLPGLVKAGQEIKQNPANAILQLMHQYGVTQQVAQAMGVQGGTPQMMQELATLKQENERLRGAVDPAAMREQFNNWQQEATVNSVVENFASKAEHWADVEPHIAPFISAVQQISPEGTAPEVVLKDAYEMAVHRLFPDKAKAPEAAPEAATAPDPAKVESAKRAASVNVQGRPTGKTKPLTEDQLLDAVWEKHQQA